MSIELSICKMADALQVPIKYDNGTVSGSATGEFTSPLGFTAPINVVAKKLFYNDQCGILFHVMGDLSMIVSHYPKTAMVSAYLIDGNMLEQEGVKTPAELFISKKHSLREVINALGKSIVASYYFKNEWKVLQLPKN